MMESVPMSNNDLGKTQEARTTNQPAQGSQSHTKAGAGTSGGGITSSSQHGSGTNAAQADKDGQSRANSSGGQGSTSSGQHPRKPVALNSELMKLREQERIRDAERAKEQARIAAAQRAANAAMEQALAARQAQMNSLEQERAKEAERNQEAGKDDRKPGMFYCPYREKRGCKKEYKHKGVGVRHHIEQYHADEPDCREQLAKLPVPVSKKAKAKEAKELSRSNIPSSIAPSMHSGMFTHGYIFSDTQQPYRPLGREVDSLYYLNVLATSGVKTHQQRTSERLLVNALLNADFIRNLQTTANAESGHKVEVIDEKGRVKSPVDPIKPVARDTAAPFSKVDVDSAILKIMRTLEESGFGDTLEAMEVVE